MLSHPAIRSMLVATLRQVAITRGACPVRLAMKGYARDEIEQSELFGE